MDRFIMLRWMLGSLWNLGMTNLGRVALYRTQLKTGWLKKKLPIGQPIVGPFFYGNSLSVLAEEDNVSGLSSDAKLLPDGKIRFFSSSIRNVGSPPSWHVDAVTGKHYPDPEEHWTRLSDFDAGDIKRIWEPSRLHWSVLAAQALRVSGDNNYLVLNNKWLADWSEKNPVNQGPNWKCAQEASIRLLNLLLATFILGDHEQPTMAMIQMVHEHCERIEPTLHYAIAQDNNHGTSEAAGLYAGGVWLCSIGNNTPQVQAWIRTGRKGLEERVGRLVAEDGSFSQHSVNYHRLMLDTLFLAEFWRRETGQPGFSDACYTRIISAIEWLWQMTDQVTGEAPNLGANDGAMLLQLACTPYRDYRPSVYLAGVLFQRQRYYSAYHDCDAALEWLGLSATECAFVDRKRTPTVMDDGGYVIFHGEHCWGVLRYPRFHFRPSHADLLHIEIMDRGISILRDGGTYSYNTSPQWLAYFPGIASHNTIQFDNGEPMPRLGRFLFGAWPEVSNTSFEHTDEIVSWRGGYTDYRGCRHDRRVEVTGRTWEIEDSVKGFREKAVLRWRLAPGEWVIDGSAVYSDLGRLCVSADRKIERMELVEGWESRCYEEKTSLPVLEVEVLEPCRLVTVIELPGINGEAA